MFKELFSVMLLCSNVSIPIIQQEPKKALMYSDNFVYPSYFNVTDILSSGGIFAYNGNMSSYLYDFTIDYNVSIVKNSSNSIYEKDSIQRNSFHYSITLYLSDLIKLPTSFVDLSFFNLYSRTYNNTLVGYSNQFKYQKYTTTDNLALKPCCDIYNVAYYNVNGEYPSGFEYDISDNYSYFTCTMDVVNRQGYLVRDRIFLSDVDTGDYVYYDVQDTETPYCFQNCPTISTLNLVSHVYQGTFITFDFYNMYLNAGTSTPLYKFFYDNASVLSYGNQFSTPNYDYLPVRIVGSKLFNYNTDMFYTQSQYDNYGELMYDKGYNVGYTKGNANLTNPFVALFNAIFNLPLLYIQDLCNFELFGVNLNGLVTGLLTFLLVIWLLKKALLK